MEVSVQLITATVLPPSPQEITPEHNDTWCQICLINLILVKFSSVRAGDLACCCVKVYLSKFVGRVCFRSIQTRFDENSFRKC